MDSTDKPRSTVPMAVVIASEQESVECKGEYTEQDDGFTLGFSINNDRFAIVHTSTCTRLSSQGLMTYDIELKDEDSVTEMTSTFGSLRFGVHTVLREVKRTADGITASLKYVLSDGNTGKTERGVDLTARFSV